MVLRVVESWNKSRSRVALGVKRERVPPGNIERIWGIYMVVTKVRERQAPMGGGLGRSRGEGKGILWGSWGNS